MGRSSLLAVVAVAGAFALAWGGPLRARAVAAPDGSKEKAAVEAATKDFHDGLRANDLAKFMSHVADDVFFMPPGEAPIRGKDGVRAWMEAFLSQYRTTTLTLSDREVRVGDGFAVELGTYEWGLAPTAGGPATTDRGNYMQVWTQGADGQWRFAREVYNSSVPAAPAPAAAK